LINIKSIFRKAIKYTIVTFRIQNYLADMELLNNNKMTNQLRPAFVVLWVEHLAPLLKILKIPWDWVKETDRNIHVSLILTGISRIFVRPLNSLIVRAKVQ